MAKKRKKGPAPSLPKGAGARKKAVKIYVTAIVVLAVVGAVFLVRGVRTGGRLEVVGNYTRGAADAAIVLEEFSDFR